jgi:hypothetical protein
MAVIRYKGAVIWMAQRQKSTVLSLIKAEIITVLKRAKSVV